MDSLQEILFTLRQNKLRTLLTAFGVFWGIFMLILLLGAGRGMQNGVISTFGSESLDSIFVWGGTTAVAYNGLGLGRNIQFRQADLEAIKEQVPEVEYVSGENSMSKGTIIYEGKRGNFDVYGVDDRYFFVKEKVPFTLGRKTTSLDENEKRKVVLLGSTVAERLFGREADPVGEAIRVNGTVMTVIGVFHDKGNNGRNSERLYMPYSTFKTSFGGGNKVHNILIKPRAGADGYQVEKDVVSLLKRRHQVAESDRRAIQSFNMAEPAERVNGVFAAINGLIWFVGLGTLTAGIVGISNIMIITVKERTREIGIRKALGATPATIVGTLLLESVLVTSVAGYAGLVLGVGLVELMAYGLDASGANLTFFQRPEVNFNAAVTAVLLLVGIGALAGLVPALKAARILPIEAMRAE